MKYVNLFKEIHIDKTNFHAFIILFCMTNEIVKKNYRSQFKWLKIHNKNVYPH